MPLFRRSRPDDGDSTYLVVGLGNPGERYERTRHNVGAMVVADLADRAGVTLRSHRSGCLAADGHLAAHKVVLARPTSFMNESGLPVGRLARFYKVQRARIIVVHDEIDIPFQQVRVKLGGGSAGHRGLRSLASHLGGSDFLRVRVGVSRPRREAADHVLSEFTRAEREELPFVIQRAADAVERIVTAGVDRAMTEFNAQARPGKDPDDR